MFKSNARQESLFFEQFSAAETKFDQHSNLSYSYTNSIETSFKHNIEKPLA